ncbi:hypothetical protein BDN72DRAFT_554290 [Pluteus cervinus]|uniref:Uncharacterized protein n=1 Tax=Pluteus cervinus TaxID=181527 RepID=A0ACD3AWP0_9AGAR|nr:hypothetical protein BDN72DRAFT_554290 [Pluteus cervinus]
MELSPIGKRFRSYPHQGRIPRLNTRLAKVPLQPHESIQSNHPIQDSRGSRCKRWMQDTRDASRNRIIFASTLLHSWFLLVLRKWAGGKNTIRPCEGIVHLNLQDRHPDDQTPTNAESPDCEQGLPER